MLEGRKEIEGLKLRPFSLGSRAACIQLGLTKFTGEDCEVSEEELQRQLVAVAWMQTTPPEEVVDALENGTAWKQIDAFAWRLPLGALAQLVEYVKGTASAAADAVVDVIPKDSGLGDTPPGNY